MDSDWVDAIASVVTALTAGAALVAASRGVHAWRDQRREEKRAEVAGQALGALLRFTGGLVDLTTPSRFGPAEESWAETIDARWVRFRPIEVEFSQAMDTAATYLDDPIESLMSAAWILRGRIWARQLAYVESMRLGGRDATMWDEAFGKTARNEIEELRARGKHCSSPGSAHAAAR